MVEPPSRGVMHFYGFPSNPPNYNWMEGFCGGKAHQWGVNGGKYVVILSSPLLSSWVSLDMSRCGVCGDNVADEQVLCQYFIRWSLGCVNSHPMVRGSQRRDSRNLGTTL